MELRRHCLTFALAVAILIPCTHAPHAFAQADSKTQIVAASPDLDARLASIEKTIDEQRQKLGVPGLSLVIVKDDRIIYMKGLGYKDFERRLPVTPETLFAIGSSSKAFTSMLVAIGSDEGKISLDDSPKKFLPYFKLQDPDADARITVRDLLSHASGLNRTDLAWITGVLDREEVIRVAATAKPTAKLREKFQYQNVMYSAAGECVAKAEGSTWENLIKSRLLTPLGMNSSTLNVPDMHRAPDYSFGYVYDENTKETRRVPTRDFPQVAAAGAINSNARDMAQWLRLLLGGGVRDGKRLVSEKSFDEMFKPQMKVAGSISYGLGWFLRDWHGHKVAEHGGNIDGFNAQVALMPDEHLGFVMLTNVSASALPASAMEVVWSNLVGGPEEKTQVASSIPSVRIEDEAGNYLLAEASVTMAIAVKDGKLTLSVPGQPTYTLEPVGGRRYKLAEVPGFYATFRPAKDNPQETEMYLEQPQGNFALKRLKAKDATTAPASGVAAEYAGPLKEVIGTYEAVAQEGALIEVTVREGRVVLVVPGQPAYPLVERSKDLLGSTALPETYSVVVRRDDFGKIIGITIKQPEGEFAFKRAVEFRPALTVEELMRKVIESEGGETALRKHKTMRAIADMSFENQGVSGDGLILAKAPGAYAEEITIKALGKKLGTIHEFFDGAQGGTEASFLPFSPKTGKALEDARIASDFYALPDWKMLFKSAEIKRMAKVGDEDAYVVVLTPEKGNPMTDYFSAKTFLLLRQDTLETEGPVTEPVTENYSDYRLVDGVMIPFTRASNAPSMGETVTKLREVRFDVSVPEDAFKRPGN